MQRISSKFLMIYFYNKLQNMCEHYQRRLLLANIYTLPVLDHQAGKSNVL